MTERKFDWGIVIRPETASHGSQTLAEYEIASYILRNSGATVPDIQRYLLEKTGEFITPGTISAVLRRREEQGYITREGAGKKGDPQRITGTEKNKSDLLDTKIWLAQVAELNNDALSASLRQNADTLYEPQQEIQAQIAEFERKLQELQSEQKKLRADADTLDRLTDWLRQDEHNT